MMDVWKDGGRSGIRGESRTGWGKREAVSVTENYAIKK